MENLFIFTIDPTNPDFLEKVKMDEPEVENNGNKLNNDTDEYAFIHQRKANVRKRRRNCRNHKVAERNKNKGTVPYYYHDVRFDNLHFRNKASESTRTLIKRGINDYFEEKIIVDKPLSIAPSERVTNLLLRKTALEEELEEVNFKFTLEGIF